MSGRTASCRCGQLSAKATGDPVWEERKHDWIEILGENVEHGD